MDYDVNKIQNALLAQFAIQFRLNNYEIFEIVPSFAKEGRIIIDMIHSTAYGLDNIRFNFYIFYGQFFVEDSFGNDIYVAFGKDPEQIAISTVHEIMKHNGPINKEMEIVELETFKMEVDF